MTKITFTQHAGPLPDEAEIQKLEGKIGMSLPRDYRDFLKSKHAFTVDDENGDGLVLDVPGFGEAVLNYLFGFCTQKNYNLFQELDRYEERIPQNCLPIADDPAGNRFLLHLPSGTVYIWDHENEHETRPAVGVSGNVYKAADSFSDLLNG